MVQGATLNADQWVTQGATQGIGSAMNLPMDPKGFAEHLSKNTLRETVRMGVDAAQGKTPDGGSIFRNIASGTLQGLAANQIGGMYAPDNPDSISFVTHKILHGLSGAGAGFIRPLA